MSVADRIAVMRDGRVEQVGTPREVYTAPTTAFVAGFLGDPGMNFLTARGHDGRVAVDAGELIHLGRPEQDESAGRTDVPPVETVGVRPEDVHVGPSDAADGADDGAASPDYYTPAIRLPIDRVDPLGHAYEVTLGGDGPRIVALTDAPPGQPGDRAAVRLDARAVHLFAADGRVIRADVTGELGSPPADRAAARSADEGSDRGGDAAERSDATASPGIPQRAGRRDGPESGVSDR